MDKLLKGILMETLIMGSLEMVKLMVKGSTIGTMVKYMMENGTMVLNMVTVYGRVFMEIPISASGGTLKLKGTVCINGKMETDTKESGRCVSSMAKAVTCSAMVICILENTKMENLMVGDNTLGKMVQFMLVNSKQDLNVGKANGRAEKDLNVTNMMENT